MSNRPSVARAVARGLVARRPGWTPGAPWPALRAEASGVVAEPEWLAAVGDNRGAGSCVGHQCRGLPDGTQVEIEVTD